MHKIPTLLKKNPEDLGLVIAEFTEGLPSVWDLDMRIKWDGIACLIQKYTLFTRYNNRRSKRLVPWAIECQPRDPMTGDHYYWVPVGTRMEYKWQEAAYTNSLIKGQPLESGTYEAIGPHFHSNPHGLEEDILQSHAVTIQELGYELNPKRDPIELYDQLKEFFKDFPYQGIVFYFEGTPVAKIRRSDFGYKKQGYKSPPEEVKVEAVV